MNKEVTTAAIANKIASVKESIKAVKASDDAHKSNKVYKLNREVRTLELITELIVATNAKYELSEAARNTLDTLTNIWDGDVVKPVEVAEGDSILDLMQKYDGRKDLLNKLTNAATKKGLRIDFAQGKVVKA